MMAYSKVVTELNKARLSAANGDEGEFDLMDAFYSACRNLDSGARIQSSPILDGWRLLTMMLDNPKRERQFAAAYRLQETDFGSGGAIAFRRMLARGARTFLEQQFSLVVERAVAQNPRVAMLGGTPGPQQKARAYINLMNARYGSWEPAGLELAQHGTMGVTPIWAEIYYLIRMGQAREALAFANSVKTEMAMKGDGNFVSYLTAWVNGLDTEDGRLPKNLRDQLLAEYNQRIRHDSGTLHRSNSVQGSFEQTQSAGTTDPFKLAVYKIIGRCELNRKNIPGTHVIRAREDWLWLQLMLVQERFTPDEPVFERYTLRECAKLVLKFGVNHFNPAGKLGDPLAWFSVLLTCGEFERAVQYLYNMDEYRVEAVHFAVAMAYFGVLRVPETPMVVDNDLLSTRTIQTGPSSLDKEEPQTQALMPHHGGLRRLDSLAPTTPTSPVVGPGHRFSLRGSEPLPGGTYEIVSLNFARLLHNYTRFFYRSDTVEALQYIYLISLYGKISDADDRSMADEYNAIAQRYVRDIVLDTRGFASLLGEVRPDGTRMPGEVEKSAKLLNLANTQDFVQNITRRAAEKAERDGGRFTEAVVLYNLAEEYDTVVSLLNKFLGERLSQQAFAVANVGQGDQTTQVDNVDGIDEALGVAQGLLGYYERNVNLANRISPENKAECNTLITLLRFMQDYESGRFENALRRQIDLGWLPLEVLDAPSQVSAIRRRAHQVQEWDENIARNLSIVLVATMDCIQRLFKNIKQRSVGRGGEVQLRELRARADNLMMFAGMLQLRMAPEAYSKLSRLHVTMM
jgi:nuclear pore complex protein Nup93